MLTVFLKNFSPTLPLFLYTSLSYTNNIPGNFSSKISKVPIKASYSLSYMNFLYRSMGPRSIVSFVCILTLSVVPVDSCFIGKSHIFAFLTKICRVLARFSKR